MELVQSHLRQAVAAVSAASLDDALIYWRKGLAAGLAVYAITLVGRQFRTYLKKRSSRKKIERNRLKFERKKDRLRESLLIYGELLTSDREAILALEFTELVEKLRTGQLQPIAVLEAFQAKALVVTETTNAVCDFIDEASEWALKLQEVSPSERGPLYGVPISVKECFMVKGYDQTVGLARFIDCPAKEDAPFVKHMKRLGAVPFCLTNVPQTMKSYGCSNPVHGLTSHPQDETRSPGGSSGGEAVLLAARASVLGIGSDVGGSLRIPAHFCGLTSLKPTTGRIYEMGRRKGSRGTALGVNSNAGFMCRSVDGVLLGMRTLLGHPEEMSAEDHCVVPVPWREEMFRPKRKLKVGWYDDTPFFPVTPGCKRAVQEAVKLLEVAGHEAVRFDVPHSQETLFMFFDHILSDGGSNSLPWWDGELLDQSIEVNIIGYKTPMWIKRRIIKPILGLFSRSMAECLPRGHLYTKDMWLSFERLSEIKTDILHAWTDAGIDVVIGPGFSFPAPPHKSPARLLPALAPTANYNVLDFPCGSLPITRESADDQAKLDTDYPRTDVLHSIVVNGTRGGEGLPLNVQVIGKPWEEELVLHAMEELETRRNFYKMF